MYLQFHILTKDLGMWLPQIRSVGCSKTGISGILSHQFIPDSGNDLSVPVAVFCLL